VIKKIKAIQLLSWCVFAWLIWSYRFFDTNNKERNVLKFDLFVFVVFRSAHMDRSFRFFSEKIERKEV